MKTKQKSFIFYDSDLECVEFLSNKQIGTLFKAIAKYRLEEVLPDFSEDAALNILFHQITTHMAMNEEKYKTICEQRSLAARKRWDAKEKEMVQEDANASKCIQDDAKRCYNDNVNDIDNDIDNVNDIDIENENDASALTSGSGAEAPTITVDALLAKYRKIIDERRASQ